MRGDEEDTHNIDEALQARCGMAGQGAAPCADCRPESYPGLSARLLDGSAIATFVIDSRHTVVLWNRACEELTGNSAGDMIGTDHHWKPFYEQRRPTLSDIILLGEYSSLGGLYNKYARSTLNRYGIQAEGWYKNLNGRDRYMLFDAAPVFDDRGGVAFVIETLQDISGHKLAEEEVRRYRDQLGDLVRERTAELRESNARLTTEIAERRRMEEEVLRAQKLESLGLLAGGIAHDFNNLLTGVLGNISLARLDPRMDRRTRDILSEAEKASNRARDLTKQLLTFSKGGAPVLKLVSIGGLIRDSAEFAVRGSKASCEFRISGDLWSAEVDEGQISQVIHNLVINADQAMPTGGIISLRCENLRVAEGGASPLASGNYVKISVTDQGIGIHESYLPHIFDPYFTTKSKGSGLGLATAYSIVSKHGGHITVSSQPGKGSVFEVCLPAKDMAPAADTGGPHKQIYTGEGRVLVMDDEDAIRLVLNNMLTHLGYEPAFAENGEEALAQYHEAAAAGFPFRAVILDLTVRGGMGGLDCLRRLRESDPAVRAIVSSGYSEDPVMFDHRRYGFQGIIVKPYQVEDLGEVLFRAIAGSAP